MGHGRDGEEVNHHDIIVIIPIDAHLESLCVLVATGVQALIAIVHRNRGRHTLV